MNNGKANFDPTRLMKRTVPTIHPEMTDDMPQYPNCYCRLILQYNLDADLCSTCMEMLETPDID